jgi:hypothetical protein
MLAEERGKRLHARLRLLVAQKVVLDASEHHQIVIEALGVGGVAERNRVGEVRLKVGHRRERGIHGSEGRGALGVGRRRG